MTMPVIAYLGIGSNLGDPVENCRKALRELAPKLPDMVDEASVHNIVPMPAAQMDAEDLARELEELPKPLQERARASGRPDLRHAKRVVQPIVDSVMKSEFSLVGLTALKDHDEYTYAHCVNVSVLSVGMGQVLGLPRQALADLGVAGLLHDLGKMSVDGDVLRKPAALDAAEWAQMKRHPLAGAVMVSRMPGLTQVMIDAMRGCLEHHMNYNVTGYPETTVEWGQATMSRIVAMADCFDAITAHRAYYKRPRTAFERATEQDREHDHRRGVDVQLFALRERACDAHRERGRRSSTARCAAHPPSAASRCCASRRSRALASAWWGRIRAGWCSG